jgi:hypothetical protein
MDSRARAPRAREGRRCYVKIAFLSLTRKRDGRLMSSKI